MCHLLIAALATLAVAGMKNTTVMTKTEVYVLADVSHSTSEKTDLIDSYIKETKENLSKNSEMGVITFASEYKLHTPLGEEFITVKGSGVDDSATDILSALKYVDTLFTEGTIKRVVLYTDGMSTDPDANSGLIRAIENLSEKNVYIDVIYIDSNPSENATEIQISDVEFNSSTYLGHETTANILIESTSKVNSIVRLSKNGMPYLEKTAKLTEGYNMVNFDLATSEAGENDYTVSVYSEGDTSEYNNRFNFTQTVNEKISVLLVTDSKSDVDIVRAIYGENAIIDAYVKPDPPPPPDSWGNSEPQKPFNVPFTVEDLCKYDEYVLSNVAIDEIVNADNFIASIDLCVSVFGKSLITAGDNNLTNNDAKCVDSLNNMLPIKFGNQDADPKLYTIVIDTSRSMQYTRFEYFKMAKNAGKYLLDFLNDGDYFSIVNFSGEVYVPITPMEATDENITYAKSVIDSFEVTQGTMIGKTLDRVNEMLADYSVFTDRQVMLISDGLSFEGGESSTVDDPKSAAERLKNSGVVVSTLNVGNDMAEAKQTMNDIAGKGGGTYYFAKDSADLTGIMFDQIANDVTETFVTKETKVHVNRQNDSVLKNVKSIPNVSKYIYAKSKASAENVLYADFKKSSGAVVKAPIYSYWNYGNGKVSTLTTALGGEWIKNWNTDDSKTFLSNITTTNIPKEKIDYPYTIETMFDGKSIHIEIIPSVINPDATMRVKITHPDGTETKEKLVFDSYCYFYKFDADAIGKYIIETEYDFKTKDPYKSSSVLNISYSPEYNRFKSFSPAILHTIVRNNGTITENGNATLTIDENKLETYVAHFTVPLLAAAAVIYVIDTIIRKLRWADIVSFFSRRKSMKEVKK